MKTSHLACAVVVCCASLPSAPALARDFDLSPEERIEDLEFLLDAIENTHPDWTWNASAEEWADAIETARDGLSSASETEFYLRLARLTAMLRDGHSSLYPPVDSDLLLYRYPIEFGSFSDGVWIAAADPMYESAIGTRVIQIGDTPIDDALEQLTPYCFGDNPQSDRWTQLAFLRIPTIHQALGWTTEALGGTFIVEDVDGNRSEIELTVSEPGPHEYRLVRGEDWTSADPPSDSTPRWHTKTNKPYWMEFLDDSGTVYVKYNSVGNDESDPFPGFCARVLETTQREDAKRLVIDLRGNGGGNNEFTFFIIDAAIKSPLNVPGKLFVITNYRVYSAAQNCASRMETLTYAIFVGEPTGGRPNHYGDATSIMLPNSGYWLRCSTLRWMDSQERDKRPWIMPDVRVPFSFADYAAGRDAALEAILEIDPEDWKEWGEVWPTRHWWRDGQFDDWP